MTTSDYHEYGPPEVGDVVHVDGATFIVRDVRSRTGEMVLVSSGRTDPGFWVAQDRCTVVFRYDLTRERDDA